MSERVLVLGAAGFIGSHLVQSLAETDWATPIAASRRSIERNGDTRVEYVTCDATSTHSLKHALKDVDGVVNCVAGEADTIVRNARALCAALSSATRPLRIVHLSSVAAYGSVEGIVDETAPLLGDLGPYSAAKAEADRIFIECGSAVILRPGIVYGPGSRQWSDRIGRLLFSQRLGDLGAAGDGFCNLVYVRDIATAILSALRTTGIVGEAFNLSLPSPPTWNEYFIRYALALGAVPVRRISQRRLAIETRLIAIPLKLLEIVARRCGMEPASLPPAIPPSLLRTCRQELRLQVDKAESVLGMRWTPLDEGLRQTAGTVKCIAKSG